MPEVVVQVAAVAFAVEVGAAEPLERKLLQMGREGWEAEVPVDHQWVIWIVLV